MTNTTIKTVLFAGLVAALLIPFMGQQEAEAAMAAPVFDGISTGLVVDWWGTVAHAPSQSEWGNQVNMCGQSFTASGFYDTVYNKRGASHYVPQVINGLCNIDQDISGTVNLTLQKVEYTFYGDGNTSIIRYDAGSNYANVKFFTDAVSNSGYEWINVKATYVHTT